LSSRRWRRSDEDRRLDHRPRPRRRHAGKSTQPAREKAGGEIVAQGTPEDIVRVARSYTGQFLKPVLGRRENKRKKGGQQAAE
jgi:hypothetical protein